MGKLTRGQRAALESAGREIRDCRDWLKGERVILAMPTTSAACNVYTCPAAEKFGQPESIATFNKQGTQLAYLDNALRRIEGLLALESVAA